MWIKLPNSRNLNRERKGFYFKFKQRCFSVVREMMGFIEIRSKESSFYRLLADIESFLIKLLYFKRRNHKAILLRKNNAIYFPIEKVATRSLNSIFKLERPVRLAKKYNYNKRYEKYFKFAFVRNPWDRAVSCYCDKILRNNFRQHIVQKNGLYPFMPFEEFIERISTIPDMRMDQHMKSQSFFLLDKNEELLVDFVGKFENIERDYKKVCKRIGLEKAPNLPCINKTYNRKNYRSYYNKKTRNLIRERYKKDIELFGYEF